MRHRTLEILGHLSRFISNSNKDLVYDAEEVWIDLESQGYSHDEIENALCYIEKTLLNSTGPFWSSDIPVHRIYSDEENTRISVRARGYLWKLKCRGIIDHGLEEEIIQKILNLEDGVGLREIKTIAALTIFGYEHKHQADMGVVFHPLH